MGEAPHGLDQARVAVDRKWMHGWMNEQMNGRTDAGWTDAGWMDAGWLWDVQLNNYNYHFACIVSKITVGNKLKGKHSI